MICWFLRPWFTLWSLHNLNAFTINTLWNFCGRECTSCKVTRVRCCWWKFKINFWWTRQNAAHSSLCSGAFKISVKPDRVWRTAINRILTLWTGKAFGTLTHVLIDASSAILASRVASCCKEDLKDFFHYFHKSVNLRPRLDVTGVSGFSFASTGALRTTWTFSPKLKKFINFKTAFVHLFCYRNHTWEMAKEWIFLPQICIYRLVLGQI